MIQLTRVKTHFPQKKCIMHRMLKLLRVTFIVNE